MLDSTLINRFLDAHPHPLLFVTVSMRTHTIESNLRHLNETFKLPHVDDLIARKVAGDEKALFAGDDLVWHEAEYNRLCALLDEARDQSTLPDEPSTRPALDDLLVRVRMKYLQ